MTDDPRALLLRRIEESGLSSTEFARRHMVRDRRTVARWLAGRPIPESVVRWLRAPPEPWPPPGPAPPGGEE